MKSVDTFNCGMIPDANHYLLGCKFIEKKTTVNQSFRKRVCQTKGYYIFFLFCLSRYPGFFITVLRLI